jgi:hypothetical protein
MYRTCILVQCLWYDFCTRNTGHQCWECNICNSGLWMFLQFTIFLNCCWNAKRLSFATKEPSYLSTQLCRAVLKCHAQKQKRLGGEINEHHFSFRNIWTISLVTKLYKCDYASSWAWTKQINIGRKSSIIFVKLFVPFNAKFSSTFSPKISSTFCQFFGKKNLSTFFRVRRFTRVPAILLIRVTREVRRHCRDPATTRPPTGVLHRSWIQHGKQSGAVIFTCM